MRRSSLAMRAGWPAHRLCRQQRQHQYRAGSQPLSTRGASPPSSTRCPSLSSRTRAIKISSRSPTSCTIRRVGGRESRSSPPLASRSSFTSSWRSVATRLSARPSTPHHTPSHAVTPHQTHQTHEVFRRVRPHPTTPHHTLSRPIRHTRHMRPNRAESKTSSTRTQM